MIFARYTVCWGRGCVLAVRRLTYNMNHTVHCTVTYTICNRNFPVLYLINPRISYRFSFYLLLSSNLTYFNDSYLPCFFFMMRKLYFLPTYNTKYYLLVTWGIAMILGEFCSIKKYYTISYISRTK